MLTIGGVCIFPAVSYGRAAVPGRHCHSANNALANALRDNQRSRAFLCGHGDVFLGHWRLMWLTTRDLSVTDAPHELDECDCCDVDTTEHNWVRLGGVTIEQRSPAAPGATPAARAGGRAGSPARRLRGGAPGPAASVAPPPPGRRAAPGGPPPRPRGRGRQGAHG